MSCALLDLAFYEDLFRPDGEYLGVGDPLYTSEDVGAGFETELLLAWWQASSSSTAIRW